MHFSEVTSHYLKWTDIQKLRKSLPMNRWRRPLIIKWFVGSRLKLSEVNLHSHAMHLSADRTSWQALKSKLCYATSTSAQPLCDRHVNRLALLKKMQISQIQFYIHLTFVCTVALGGREIAYSRSCLWKGKGKGRLHSAADANKSKHDACCKITVLSDQKENEEVSTREQREGGQKCMQILLSYL